MYLCESRYTDVMQLFNVIQAMVSWVNRSVNESSPIVDARLADGSRVNIVLRPVAINGPVVTIRKFSEKSFTMEDFLENRTLSKDEADFLADCVRAGVNIFVSGGTSSGKTTFLNVLSGYIGFEERVITVEDSAELRLPQPNIVRLETKNSNSEGKGEIGMRKLIKTALRMRPDRIIVGEVRDESALDMLQAMCTGHDGSMSTAHANSAQDTLTRIETMALWEGNISGEAIRKQIASGLDLIVHLKRDFAKGRRVAEIAEVVGCDGGCVCLHSLFRDGQRLCECQEGGKVYEKLRSKAKR
jgi:pilus assembly protein CpaF